MFFRLFRVDSDEVLEYYVNGDKPEFAGISIGNTHIGIQCDSDIPAFMLPG